MTSLVGQTVSHYKVLELLGGGGMGIVYKARDLKLDRIVALKFLPTELTRDPNARERFIHEAKAASGLQHNNICTVHDIDQAEDGQLFIAMDCYEGETLKRKIEEGPVSIEIALELGIQAVQGLAEAHQRGIVHRDVKPANILITRSGVAKILDFGLAKLAGLTRVTRIGSTLGTAAYMSPEQARGEQVDQRTDIWSLGVILYEMLSGQLPFKSGHEAALLYSILNEDPLPLQQVRPEIPEALSRIIQRTLAKDPAERHENAAELLVDLQGFRTGFLQPSAAKHDVAVLARKLKQPRIFVPLALVTFLVVGALGWYLDRAAKIRWARNEALPEISRLVDEAQSTGMWAKYDGAFNIAKLAEKYIPDDSSLAKLWPEFSRRLTIVTIPPGAKVYRKEYSSIASDWRLVGTTPLDRMRSPWGFFRWKFELSGFDTAFAVSLWQDSLCRTLDTFGETPPGMVRVSGGKADELENIVATLGDFFLDKHEVTNAQYKKFVDAGGYHNRQYWKHEFIKNSRPLTWEEAQKEFVDATGRPGPSTWQAGDYPEGQDQYPVSGISWYEAAAYADFVGKDLPTTHHWYLAAGFRFEQRGFSTKIAELSNFNNSGPSPVGAHEGMNSFGAYDMAGNVREWCWNASKDGRCIRGGAWNDITYMYSNLSQAPAFDRSPKNGIRCALYIDKDKIPEHVFGPVEWATRDYAKEKPVSDLIFRVYKDRFLYDRTDLNPVIEKRDESSPDWVREKVTFDAAYGKERVNVLIFLPKKAVPPYQAVIFFPGSYALWVPTSDAITDVTLFDFIAKNGRAVVYPVYYGTYERNTIGVTPEMHWPTKEHRNEYTELLIKWVKDFSRTIDYLETRKDIDTSKLAYYGFSWGGRLGSVIPAVEGRLKASVLFLGGFVSGAWARPEADEFNYAPRVRIPTLMLNGKYDMVFPYKTTVEPMYERLGATREQKRLLLYDSDHYVPLKDVIKETLSWFDQSLGPVK